MIKTEGQLVDLIQRISVLNKYEKVISNGNSTVARWFKGTTIVFRDLIPTGRIVVFLNENNEIRTMKTIEKNPRDIGDEEMQTLNNNNGNRNVSPPKYEQIIVNTWLPQKFQEVAKMEPKIMKKIKNCLEEKKIRFKQEADVAYRRKMDEKILRDIISIKMQNIDRSDAYNKILSDIEKIKNHDK